MNRSYLMSALDIGNEKGNCGRRAIKSFNFANQ